MTDWATVAELAAASGTLVLAVATFDSVRSSNRVRATGGALAARPVAPAAASLSPRRRARKVGFQDGHWTRVYGGHTNAEVGDNAIYLAIALRNAGDGPAVLNRWTLWPEALTGPDQQPPDVTAFRLLTRDL